MSASDNRPFFGRKKLLTDHVPESMSDLGGPVINEETIPDIMSQIWTYHESNRFEISYLLDYYRGHQDILFREKEIRPEINNKIVFNHAMAITRDIVGYTFGKPVCYVHRSEEVREAVKELTEMTENEDKFTSDQELAQYTSICGTAYRGVFDNTYGVDDSIPFSIVTLDPRNTFVVYSTAVGNPPVLACTYYEITPSPYDMGGEYAYIFYTRDKVYEYKSSGSEVGAIGYENHVRTYDNPLGMIPIVEYPNNMWRIGDWEMAKTLLDAINLVGSDCVNDLEGVVNALLVGVNVDLNDLTQEQLKASKMLSFPSIKEAPSDVKYVYNAADPSATESLRSYLLEQMRIIVGMPTEDTSSNTGGDTGDAVYLRNGYERLEAIARMKETFFKRSERQALRLILTILDIENQGLGIRDRDVTIKFSRSMTDNLSAKTSALSVLHGTQILTPTDALEMVGITTEPDELARKGEEYWTNRREADVQLNGNSETDSVNESDPSLVQKVER